MRTRNLGKARLPKTECLFFPSFGFRVPLFVVLLTAGCGAPGEPVPPSPPVPVAVTDLSAHQAGDAVLLAFTPPSRTISGDRLTQSPAVEILRGSLKPDASPDTKSFHTVDTIPGSLLNNYLSEGRVQFADPVSSEDLKAYSNGALAYLVRTRVSSKRVSADSNVATLQMLPVPERIQALGVLVTESAIQLNWQPPTHTSGGEPLTTVSEYRVYRGEIDPASLEAAQKDLAQAKWTARLTLLASSDFNSYRDPAFEFGKTYVYVVRSVVSSEKPSLESSNSIPAIVKPIDTFPPVAPQNVVAAVSPGTKPETREVDLSWSINSETDLAGYRVYRSEQEGTRGTLINAELLLTPALRDNSVETGHHYWYTVTAVDRAGNESAGSTPVMVDVTQPIS